MTNDKSAENLIALKHEQIITRTKSFIITSSKCNITICSFIDRFDSGVTNSYVRMRRFEFDMKITNLTSKLLLILF